MLALCALSFAAAAQYDDPSAREWDARTGDEAIDSLEVVRRAYLWRLADRLGRNGGPREFALAAHVRAMAGVRDLRIVGGLRLIDVKTQRWLNDAERLGSDDPVVQLLLLNRFSASDPIDRRRDAVRRWREIDSDNLAPLLVGGADLDALPIDETLAFASSALRADFYFDDIVRPLVQAVSEEPPPASLLATVAVRDPSVPEAFGAEIGAAIWSASAAFAYAPLTRACRGDALDAAPRRRAQCRHVAMLLADRADTVAARGVGAALRLRTYADENELRQAAIAYRRHYWRLQQRASLAQRNPVDEARTFARMLLDDRDITEAELAERMVIDAGLPLEPPPGWTAPQRY